jgi:hypothetical protein
MECINGLDERGIACEGLQRGRLISPEERRKVILLSIQRWEPRPAPL